MSPVWARNPTTSESLSQTRLGTALNLLERAGAVTIHPGGEVERQPRRSADGDGTEAAVAASAGLEEDHRRVKQSRIEMLRDYAEDDACRRWLLLTYFGEPFEPPCGVCDNCGAVLAAEPRPDLDDLPFPVDAKVRHKAWGPGRVLRYDGDRMVVLSDRAGYRTLSVATVLERKPLRGR